MQKNKRRMTTRVLTTAALLAALSAVIGIVCKNLFTFNIKIYPKFIITNNRIRIQSNDYG